MHTVVKQDIHIDLILTGAHIDMVLGDLREFFHNALGPNAHKLRIHRSGNKYLGHFGQLTHKFLCAFDHRLAAEKLRVLEKFKDHIRPGAQSAPSIHLVNGQRGVKFIFLIGQPNGVRNALHQQVIHIQGRGKPKLSVHSVSSLSIGRLSFYLIFRRIATIAYFHL